MTYVAGWWEPHYDVAAPFSSKSGKNGKSGKSGKSSKSGKSGKGGGKSGKENSTDGSGGANHGHGWYGDGYGRGLRRHDSGGQHRGRRIDATDHRRRR